MPKPLLKDAVVQEWIERFPDKQFATELVQFIDNYNVVGPGVAGVHVVEALEDFATFLRGLGWDDDR